HPRPVSTTSRRYRPRCRFPTRYDWLSTVTVPAGPTRRMKVTRPTASFCRPVGTTRLAGSFRSRNPRRGCAGVWPPSRGAPGRGGGGVGGGPPRRRPPRPPRRAAGRGVGAVEQRGPNPAVEVPPPAVELRLAGRDEHRPDAEPQAEPDDPRQGAGRRPPAGQLAGVVEPDLLGEAQALPALAEEPEDLGPAAGNAPPAARGCVRGGP